MRIEVIFCPSCNNKLRVPEELMARPVQCPQCRATFLAPPPSTGAIPPPLPAPAESSGGAITRQAPPEPEERAEPRRVPTFDAYDLNEPDRMPAESNDAKVLAPAFVLLAVVALGAVLDAVELVFAALKPNDLKKAFAAYGLKMPPGSDPVTMYLLIYGLFFAMSLFSIFGAVCMMRRKLFPIAVLGSIAAMLNITHCCCIPGSLAAMWALFILFQPEVRASFH